jgi:hypothetical protein
MRYLAISLEVLDSFKSIAGNVLNKVEFGRDGNMDLRELGKRIPLYITAHYCITKYCRRTDGLFALFNTGNVSECRDLLYIPTPKAASLASRTVVCYCNSHSLENFLARKNTKIFIQKNSKGI